MNAHPGGEAHTLRMLELSGLRPGARILDMGAGAGESVRLLRERGFFARGIDLEPRGENVDRGDFLHCPFPDGSFDGILSQCAFYAGGDVPAVLDQCRRLLRGGGVLMLSDVCFAPLAAAAEEAGFAVIHSEDLTASWREYYIEAIWRGSAECVPVKGKCAYQLIICVKEPEKWI